MMIQPTPTHDAALKVSIPPGAADRPRVKSIERARHELGDIGKTKFYEVAHKYGIRLLKFGSRTVVPTEDIDRVIDDILAGGEGKTNADQAKAAAATSVASRRRRRGCAP